MTAQSRRVADMSIEELRALIADEMRNLLEQLDAPETAGAGRTSTLAAARQYIEEHRFTLPTGSPPVEELVRQERDRWQP